MMDINTGKVMPEADYIKQCVFDVLLTAKGETLLNREYGSDLYLLLDKPSSIIDGAIAAQIINDVNSNLALVKVSNVKVDIKEEGKIIASIELNNNQTIEGELNGAT